MSDKPPLGWVNVDEVGEPEEPGFYWVKWKPPFGCAEGFLKLFSQWNGSIWLIVSIDGANGDELVGTVLEWHHIIAPES